MNLDYKKIGKRIAARRHALGLKQWQVSELADISTTYMSSIERAISIPSTEVVMRLAIALERGRSGRTWRSCCGPWTAGSWI